MSSDLVKAVKAAVHTEIEDCDWDQALRLKDYDAIHREVSDAASKRLLDEMRTELSNGDHAFIKSKVGQLVREYLARPVKSRFERFDRVVCKIGGERGWGAGTIQALDEDDPQDPTGQRKLPYVVKLDPPIGRLISVPYDENGICRAEICFAPMSRADLGLSLRCKPQRKETRNPPFVVGDRVACAVETPDDDYGLGTVWAPGSVTDVDFDVEPDARELSLSWDWTGGAGVMPYRVLLDSGAHVLVHRDVHWLVRDLALQPAGPRQAEDGTRSLKRLEKRRRGASEWELIDHATRRVRVQAADEKSSDDEAA